MFRIFASGEFNRYRELPNRATIGGTVRCSVCYRGVVGIRVAYSYLLYFSDQFSCIKFFDLTYGLKDIDFQSLKQFTSFLKAFLNYFY